MGQANFQFDDRAGGPHRENAVRLAEFSKLAYEDGPGIEQECKRLGFDDCRFFDNKGAQAFVTFDDKVIVVCFRGTDGEIADWLNNIKVKLTTWKWGKVHQGFQGHLINVWDDRIYPHVTALLEEREERKIWITGHSLGAAMATLATARLVEAGSGAKIGGLYTFGQPKTANRKFAKEFDQKRGLKAISFRFVHNNDVVPKIPFTTFIVFKYKHIGTFVYFNRNKRWKRNWGWLRIQSDGVAGRVISRIRNPFRLATDGLVDHRIQDYIDCAGNIR